MESVGFKEWSAVCEALGRGRQSVIIRKGGLAEGRDGFSFQHSEFWLFPTWFHGAASKIRDFDFPEPRQDPEKIEIRFLAKVDESFLATSWRAVKALEPLHILKEEVVRERFDYEEPRGVHVALVRIFQIEPAWRLPNEKRFGGCKSWVQLPSPPPFTKAPAITDEEHGRRLRHIHQALKETSKHGPVRQA